MGGGGGGGGKGGGWEGEEDWTGEAQKQEDSCSDVIL